jgi:hypothetical protein
VTPCFPCSPTLAHSWAPSYAVYLEDRRCGELDASVEDERVWMTCTGCGAVLSRSLTLTQTDQE